MNFFFLRFMSALAVIRQVSGLPLACSYNETLYKEGESVSTEEPCLSCVCRKGSLACTLRVCADSPEPLPPGCFLVHRADDCCPRLLCEEGFGPNGVELRSGFKAEKKLVDNGCFVNGSIYAEGSAVASSRPCEYCYCIQGEVKCIKPRCLHPFRGCRPLYEGSSCCPTHYDCRNVAVDVPTTPTTRGCETEGVYHSEGELVESSNSSKCETCYCAEGKVKCAPMECPMDIFEHCQPLGGPDQCCPTSFSCGKSHPKTGNNSYRSLPIPKAKPNNEYASTGMPEHSTEATEPRDSENTTAEENSTEGSTDTWETEATTPLALLKMEEEPNIAENLTISGFQVVKLPNDMAVPITEETTSESETTSPSISPDPLLSLGEKKDVFDVEIQTKLDFADQRGVLGSSELGETDGILSNSSQEFHDDYDSYDYSEPKLPPSLPNLVIFPFVAADAVVKGESTPQPKTYDSNSVKRIDTQGAFYKDYFSPPARTEGGFVPKETALPGEPFYDNSFYNKDANPSNVKEYTKTIPHITAPTKLKKEKCYSEGRELEHGELLSEAGDCVSCACLHGSIICQDVTCATLEPGCKRVEEKPSSCCGRIACEPKSGEAKTEITRAASEGAAPGVLGPTPPPSRAESPPDLLLTSDSATLLLGHETKPVTVAYKNVVVDYYPDYLITRNTFRTKNGEKNPQKAFVSAASPAGFSFSEVSSPPPKEDSKKTHFPQTTAVTTTSESFFDEFLKNFLSEDTKSTTRTVPKYKYSSKIKSPVTTTTRPNVEDVTRDAKPSPNRQNPSASSYSLFDFLFDSEPPPTSPRTKKGESSPPPEEPGLAPTNEAEEKEGEERGGGVEANANLGSFLKLAGCNIYGRMYRVGKIIIELSGPCLECVCTDFGVQCKPLIC